MTKNYYRILLWILIAAVLVLLKGFMLPAILGAISALLLYKPTKIVEKKVKNYKTSVILTTTVVGGLFFLPLMFLLFSGASEIIIYIKSGQLSSFMSELPNLIQNNIPMIQSFLPISIDSLKSYGTETMQFVGSYSVSILQGIVLQFPKLLMDLAITIFSTYVFLLEKDQIKSLILNNKLFSKEETEDLYNSVVTSTNSVVISSLISGLLQAVVMAIVASIVAPDKILLISVLTFLFSFIPVVGTSPITLSLTITSWFGQEYGNVAAVLIGVGFLTLIDNVLKPMMIGNKIKIHPLLAFLSAMGGLTMFGFYGLFLGPIMVGILFSLLKKEL